MRYALTGAGVLTALILVIVVTGALLPARHQASRSATYAASADSLYAIITDVAGFSSWRTGLVKAERLPDDGGAPRFRETTRNGSITYAIDSAVPPRTLVTRIVDQHLGFGGSWTYEVTPAGEGRAALRIQEDGIVTNLFFRVVSRFVIGHDATIRRYLRDLDNRVRRSPVRPS